MDLDFQKGRLVSSILVRVFVVSNVQALAMETWLIAFNKEWTLNDFTTWSFAYDPSTVPRIPQRS